MNRSFQDGLNAVTRNQDPPHDEDEEDDMLVVPDLISFPEAPFAFLDGIDVR